MQFLAIALATSLVFGPAPAVSSVVQAPLASDSEAPESATSLPDVDDDPAESAAEFAPEVEAEPESEPEQEPASAAPPPSVEQGEVVTAPVSVERDRLGCQGSPSCQRMTVVGIVVGTIGLAAVGTGVGLLVNKDEVVPESPTFVSSTRPAGIVTLTLGASVTLTATLMVVAAHRGKQRSKRARVELTPTGLRF